MDFEKLAHFLGYESGFKGFLNLGAWIMLMYALYNVAVVYQHGAENCVRFQPIADAAQACLDLNNKSVAKPDIVFIPQPSCQRIDTRYNSGFGAGSNLTNLQTMLSNRTK